MEYYAVIGAPSIDSPPWVLLCENRSDADALFREDIDAVQVQPVTVMSREDVANELSKLANPELDEDHG